MKDFTNKHINANYRKGTQTYVGNLWFYVDGLEYKAKSVNSTINLGKIPYSEISSIKSVNTIGFIPNGIIIQLTNGKKFNYVIGDRKSVIKFIESKIK
ncbi:MAG: hypothetical protein E7544_01925 [Ruminococcaceae bacterium]|nr:hypothetical protein [Oscillospiraceae bacterium]